MTDQNSTQEQIALAILRAGRSLEEAAAISLLTPTQVMELWELYGPQKQELTA